MRVVNLTPHELTFHVDGQLVALPPSGEVARCSTTEEVVGHVEVDGVMVPVVSTKFGEVIGLPEPKPDTVYVVSALVASAVRRRDVLSPGSLVRDKEGRVVGAASFVLQEGSA
jgi:hypothetical protein